MPRTRFLPHWKAFLSYLRDPNSDWKPKVLSVLALLYLIMPLDFIPDLAPLIGWLDDLGLTTVATIYLLQASKRYETQRGKFEG